MIMDNPVPLKQRLSRVNFVQYIYACVLVLEDALFLQLNVLYMT